jgi:hypothetical protein
VNKNSQNGHASASGKVNGLPPVWMSLPCPNLMKVIIAAADEKMAPVAIEGWFEPEFQPAVPPVREVRARGGSEVIPSPPPAAAGDAPGPPVPLPDVFRDLVQARSRSPWAARRWIIPAVVVLAILFLLLGAKMVRSRRLNPANAGIERALSGEYGSSKQDRVGQQALP